MTDATPTTAPAEPAESPRKLPRWRRALVAILVILSVVFVPIAGLTVWVRNLVLDTGKYVDTVAPLAENKAITDQVANRLTTRLFQEVNVEQQARDALPERAQFLAGPIASGTQTFVHTAAQRALATEQFATIWRQANERAHAAVVKALTGQGKNVTVKNGKVVLDLSAVIDQVVKRLDARGVTVFDSLAKDQKNLQVTLFNAEQLQKARGAVHLLDRLRIVLIVLVFVFLGAALLLSGNRRRTLMRWGIGLVIAMAIVAVLLALGRSAFLGVAQNRDAAGAAFDTIVRYLRNGFRAIAVLGLVVALAAFLSGPSRLAVRIREGSRDLIRGAGRQTGWDTGAFGIWVGAHKTALRITGVVVAILVLFLWDRPRPLTLLVLALLLLVYLAAIEFLGRTAAPADANAGAKPADGTS
jgi:hypothetical protein